MTFARAFRSRISILRHRAGDSPRPAYRGETERVFPLTLITQKKKREEKRVRDTEKKKNITSVSHGERARARAELRDFVEDETRLRRSDSGRC